VGFFLTIRVSLGIAMIDGVVSEQPLQRVVSLFLTEDKTLGPADRYAAHAYRASRSQSIPTCWKTWTTLTHTIGWCHQREDRGQFLSEEDGFLSEEDGFSPTKTSVVGVTVSTLDTTLPLGSCSNEAIKVVTYSIVWSSRTLYR
jgi:hypothetical protein